MCFHGVGAWLLIRFSHLGFFLIAPFPDLCLLVPLYLTFFRFETALRMKDPAIAVPYWASNLDSEMEDPSKSIIWSEDFLGNGDGFVVTGPFKEFRVHSTDSVLNRNVGAAGSLFTNEGIHGILSQNNTRQIITPTAGFENNLEQQHNTAHRWVGGNMDDLSTSAWDPVFYLHHSFVDYLWEEFRTKQKVLGIDPERDYPDTNYGTEHHASDAPLGFADLRNIDAVANVFADLVKYDPSPACSIRHPSCGSKYLRCDLERPIPLCISLSREEVHKKLDDDMEICVEPHLSRAVQNNFAINQFCDIRKWAYITVNVILQRPPEFVHYNAYPVYNNEPERSKDIFSTVTSKKNISQILATYPNCRRTNSVARKIFIESHGLNYYGNYKDFTVLDQRHALSSATTYVGIKSPDTNYTDVILYAYDFCGRSCRAYCLDMSLPTPKSKPCAGVIRVTPDEPKLYGSSYADAINNVWRADHQDDLPEVVQNQAAVTFYCDYSGAWPWDENIQLKRFQQNRASKVNNKATPQSMNRDNPSSSRGIKHRSENNVKENARSIKTVKTIKAINQIPEVRTFDLRTATSRPTLPRSNFPITRPTQIRTQVSKPRSALPSTRITKTRVKPGSRKVNSNIKTASSNQRMMRRNPLFRRVEMTSIPQVQNKRTRMPNRLGKYMLIIILHRFHTYYISLPKVYI